ncbi:hypothetical protein [Janthinobacterium agaricidamnosum]|uniref:Uncharacterized protein n=1 Tax=Janthinobacterium agaricidamnosum NBRC 102515 = DSM 9628 TaxID=1349767 RepID=W0UZW7_9BURK|nr:hypothetical protein [Janthinobacterium agaricidamnosum]CDG81166.1 hypothetical protein GJA_506 [Janthinobacterium agaricidamnosum NBRC 102515 = DSM 9628]
MLLRTFKSSLLLFLVLLTGVLTASIGATAQAQAAIPPPIADFFDNPEFSAALLSPDGRWLAMRMNGPQQRERLAVVDLSDYSIKVVAEFADVDIGEFEWVNPQRLIYNTRDRQIGRADLEYGPGLYAVNRDGSAFKQLASRSGTHRNNLGVAKMLPWHTFMMQQKGAQDTEYVYVLSQHYNSLQRPDYVDLLRLNTLTGHGEIVPRPGKTRRWLLDHQGQPRLAVTGERDMEQIFYRDPGKAEWRKLAEFKTYFGGPGNFVPFAFGPNGTLYVSARVIGDKSAIYSYDLQNSKIADQPLVTISDYDFDGSLITNKHDILGIRFLADAVATNWFSKPMQAVQ